MELYSVIALTDSKKLRTDILSINIQRYPLLIRTAFLLLLSTEMTLKLKSELLRDSPNVLNALYSLTIEDLFGI